MVENQNQQLRLQLLVRNKIEIDVLVSNQLLICVAIPTVSVCVSYIIFADKTGFYWQCVVT
jgi:ABC-type microcin C transport system permease subunit YejB